jgi:divalent metal cation (Fe/Co/Zn/Cd) transporter
MRKSVSGLMDTALPVETQNRIEKILETYSKTGVQYHALLTRQSGSRQFVSLHLLVPGEWTVQRGHNLLECLETDLCNALPNLTVFTHLESIDDRASCGDITLDH